MKKEIMQAVLERIRQVAELKWIDADEGQLDFTDSRPPVAFPCCLVDLYYPDAENMSGNVPTMQRIEVTIALKVGFNDCASFNVNKPLQVQNVAFSRMDVLEEIHKSLQGFYMENCVRFFRRRSCRPQKRPDGLKVYEVIYMAEFIDRI